MRTLIAVKSCRSDLDQGCHETIRQTWGKDVPLFAKLKFFVGGGNIEYHPGENADEINLRCLDDYDSLPNKTHEIVRWSLNYGYDFTFLCDVDTFLIPARLLKIGYENYDYAGRFGTARPMGKPFPYKDGRGIRHPKCYTWASGGFGYFLSKHAAKIIAESTPNIWAEDMWVGDVLGPKFASGEIKAADLPNFENEVSWHYPAHRLGWNRPRMQLWMRDMHGLYSDPYHRWTKV